MNWLILLLVALLLLAVGVLGVVIKGLFWLFVIVVVIFAAGAAFGYVRLRSNRA